MIALTPSFCQTPRRKPHGLRTVDDLPCPRMVGPSLYDPKRHPKLALSFARKGKTNYEIAAKFGITRETLKEWRKKYPELSDALSRGRDIAEDRFCAIIIQIVISAFRAPEAVIFAVREEPL